MSLRPLIVTGLAVLCALPARAQAPAASPDTPTFSSGTELVTVDAVVVDKKGDPVTGLSAADFQLLEDGKPQKIDSFEAVVLPEQPPSGPLPEKPRVSSNQDPEDRLGRTFVLVFDDIHMSPGQADRAKSALVEFLKTGVREGDRVTLVATSGAAWWSTRMMAGRDELAAMVGRLDGRYIADRSPDRITEYEAMRIQVYRDPQISARVSRRFEQYGQGAGRSTTAFTPEDDPLVRSRASEVYWQSVSRNRLTLQVLERVLDSLVATKGRKSLVLVSEGFIYDPNLDEFKRVTQSSRRANTAIFFLDTKGLGGLPPWMGAEMGGPTNVEDIGSSFTDAFEQAAGSENIALDSGGFAVKNTNDFARGIQRIAAETRVYYLLGYTPSNTAADGRFRKIEVKTRRKGVKVRARKGYYAPVPPGTVVKKDERSNDPDIQAALDSPYGMRKIPIRMTAWVLEETMVGRATAVVAADVDVRDFAFRDENGRAVDAAEFLMVVAHRETGEHFRYDQRIEMKLSPATREKINQSWLPILRDFELAPGGYQAKIVVRDANSKAIGTVVHEFEVPPLDKLRVSTPILTDALQEGPDGEAKRPAMNARRAFPTGGYVYCQFEVYNAQKNAKGLPEVSAGYVIRRKDDGREVVRVEPTQIKSTSLGRLSRLVGSPLPAGSEGELELVLTVKDEIGGQVVEVKEPFVAEAAPAPAPAAAP